MNNVREPLHIDDELKPNAFVIINPEYLKAKLSKAVPLFISIELRKQSNDAITQEAHTNSKESLDFKKIQLFLAK